MTARGMICRHHAWLLLAGLLAAVSVHSSVDAGMGRTVAGSPLLEEISGSDSPEALNRQGDRYRLGDGVPQDLGKAMTMYRRAAEAGHAAAQFNMGLMHENGAGVPKEMAEAARWYRKAADQGHALAQNNLGVLYSKGEGVARDLVQSTAWYLKAAEQGLPQAQFNVGIKYLKGEGIAPDAGKGVRWLRESARQGYAPALDALKKLGLE